MRLSYAKTASQHLTHYFYFSLTENKHFTLSSPSLSLSLSLDNGAPLSLHTPLLSLSLRPFSPKVKTHFIFLHLFHTHQVFSSAISLKAHQPKCPQLPNNQAQPHSPLHLISSAVSGHEGWRYRCNGPVT